MDKIKHLYTAFWVRLPRVLRARKWAHSHKGTITVAVIAALNVLSHAGVNLPAKDIEHVVSAIIG